MLPSVPEILERLGVPRGRGGRTRCPLHDGRNDQAFSYTTSKWYCFSCGKGGGPAALIAELRPDGFVGFGWGEGTPGRPESLPAWLGRFGGGFWERPPTRSERLTAMVERRRDEWLTAYSAIHRRALLDLALADRLGGQVEAELLLVWLYDVLDRLQIAERALGCDCLARVPPALGDPW